MLLICFFCIPCLLQHICSIPINYCYLLYNCVTISYTTTLIPTMRYILITLFMTPIYSHSLYPHSHFCFFSIVPLAASIPNICTVSFIGLNHYTNTQYLSSCLTVRSNTAPPSSYFLLSTTLSSFLTTHAEFCMAAILLMLDHAQVLYSHGDSLSYSILIFGGLPY